MFRRFLDYIPDQRRTLAACCILIVIGSAMLLAGPPLLAHVADLIEENLSNIPMGEITRICAILIAIYIISAVLQVWSNRKIAGITNRMLYTIRNDIDDKINKLSVDSVKSMNKGDILSLTMNDCDNISGTLHEIVSIIFSAFTMIIGCTILMFVTDWRLAAVTAALSVFCVFAIYKKVMMTRRFYYAQQKDLGRLTAFVTENYETNRIINLYGEKRNSKKTFTEINSRLRKGIWRTSSLSNTTVPLMSFSMYVTTAVVAIFASYLISEGEIEIAVLVAFILYVTMFFTPLLKISNMMVMVEYTFAGALRIFNFLDKDEMPEDENHGNLAMKGHVEFRNVGFGYSDEEIIHDFSLDVKPGEKIAIVGETGSGKTTLVNLLMRFYEIKSGSILIDDVSIKDLSMREVQEEFCMVLQESWIFTGTIRENIMFCHQGVDETDVVRVCDAVGLTDHINALPDGLDTVIDNNTSLSEGQRQQITLARAMLDRAPMLILDEATASIDTKTERKIQEAMEHLTANRTSFIIAHRLSTVETADLIVVMDHGRIIETGKHAELLSRNGAYREIYQSQFAVTGPMQRK